MFEVWGEYMFDINNSCWFQNLSSHSFYVSGRGVVATENIKKDSFVVLYTGKKLHSEPSGEDTYIFEVRRGKRYW